MSKIERFEDLKCWQEARILVKSVYEVTNEGMLRRDYSFRDQMRRSAISTMSNVAEGFGRFSTREFIRFLELSFTSANELKSLCYAGTDVRYLSEFHADQIKAKAEEVKALDLGLIRYLKSRNVNT